jgi:hypothetical protein
VTEEALPWRENARRIEMNTMNIDFLYLNHVSRQGLQERRPNQRPGLQDNCSAGTKSAE